MLYDMYTRHPKLVTLENAEYRMLIICKVIYASSKYGIIIVNISTYIEQKFEKFGRLLGWVV